MGIKATSLAWLTVIFFLAGGAANEAIADITLDQSNNGFEYTQGMSIDTTQTLAQTFTVGLSGLLAQVDVEVYQTPGATGNITFSILPTVNGVPITDDSAALFRKIIPLSSFPTQTVPFTYYPMTSIDVSGAGIMVNPGEVLAIELSRPGPGDPPWAIWNNIDPKQGPNVYSRGLGYYRDGSTAPWTASYDGGGALEQGFQTNVMTATPEPSAFLTVPLGALAFIGFGWLRSRRG